MFAWLIFTSPFNESSKTGSNFSSNIFIIIFARSIILVPKPVPILKNPEFVSSSEAISDLPEKQKEVFLLSRIEKMKYREIAEMLEISVKAVEKRMHLALLEMKEKIGNV